MSRQDLKLLGTRVSPFVWRIIWALKLKGLEFEFIEEDLLNKSSFLLELNPVHKMIPVLVHNGKPISESLIILEYIDETWKQYPILPKDPQSRAYARFWAKISDEKVLEVSKIPFNNTGEEQARGVKLMAEALEILEGEIKGKKFFGGVELGFLDLVIGWIAYWLQFSQEVGCYKVWDSTKYPCLDLWMNNLLQVPLISSDLPSPEEMLNTYSGYRKWVLSMNED